MDFEIEKIIIDFLRGLESEDSPSSLARILDKAQFPPIEKESIYKEVELELENRDLVQFIRGRDNSTLGGQCEYLINLNGIKYLRSLSNKTMTLEEQLIEVESKGKRYETEWKKGSQGRINSSEFISLFNEWYYESRDIFFNYLKEDNLNFKEYLSADLSGNGFTKGSQFSNLFSLFKILKKNLLNNPTPISQNSKMVKSNNVFLIHGRDDEKKFEVARFLEKELDLNVTILHEKANGGKTIIEKFEKHSEVDFAVALWTGDDKGGLLKSESELRKRARQNVIFETGFFFGKLGREKVIVLFEKDLEIPSDYSGITYLSFEDQWKDELRREVKHIYENF